MSCGADHRHGSDPVLLWLWNRLAATALIRTIAWESPYAVGMALKNKQTKKKKHIHKVSHMNFLYLGTENRF